MFCLCITFISVLLIIFREPAFLISPRIWAEEGSVYIQSVIENGSLSSLIQPHLGYYSFVANFAASISVAILGLKYAAYGTTYFSLFVNIACATAPLYLPSTYWSTKYSKAIVVLLSFVLSSGEIWLNSVNVHFYLGLFSCYFLLSDHEKLTISTRSFCNTLLFVGAFTSVTTALMFPLYIIQWAKIGGISRVSFRFYKIFPMIILFIGLVAQILFFALGTNELDGRFSITDFPNLPEGFFQTSMYLAQGKSEFLSAFFGLLILAFGANSIYHNRLKYLELLILFLYVSGVYSVLSIDMLGGGRYGYIPSILLSLYFLNTIRISSTTYSRLLIFSSIFFTAYKLQFYFDTSLFYQEDWNSFAVEYSNTISNGGKFVRVFPQWEGTNWGILLE